MPRAGHLDIREADVDVLDRPNQDRLYRNLEGCGFVVGGTVGGECQ